MKPRCTSPSYLWGDAGFSLSELLVSLSVGLLVLGVVYAIMYTGNVGAKTANRLADDDRSVGHSLDDMSRLIRESQERKQAQDYLLDITADPNNDGVLDRVQYSLDPKGQLWRKVLNASLTTVRSNEVIASGLTNRTIGRPLFLYYIFKSPSGDPSADETASPDNSYSPPRDGDRLTRTTVITLDPSVQSDPSSGSAAFNARTDIYLRNASSGS